MRDGSGFAFAGSGLDRAAVLRGQPAAVSALLASRGARVLPLWRGRPLFAGDDLGWLAPGHAALADAAVAPILLGVDGTQAWFALDVSNWQPEVPAVEAPSLFDAGEQRHPLLAEPFVFAELRTRMAGLSAREGELVATARALTEWHKSHAFCARCGAASAPSHAGWQRHCPACNADHFPRTDPVVIMLVTLGNSTLLGRSPGWPEGMYSCLAGFVEPGETVEAAVRREVAEETGVMVGAVRYVTSQPWPFPASLMLGCHGDALGGALTLDPVEIEDARWVTREELAAVFAGTHPEIRTPRRGAIAGDLLRRWLADRVK
ncbi:MAG: NAD(+) diphosphatase [Alphaproteobacteria bacterium HGW-Alphaproteobacteria-4]|nr:MAG: NAD(+) diphosphatase [Alphaproteobacteria bacterium HGW-Alphaproteobacteria-4]